MKTFKFAALLVFLFMTPLLFVSCGSKADKGAGDGITEIKVAFWGSPEEIEIVTTSMKGWQETHPKIKVRFEHTPHGGYDSKILTRIAGGAAPDVIAAEVNFFVTFVTRGVFVDLKPYIDVDPTVSVGDFFPSIIERFSIGDSVYALPRDVAPFACVYYNKELFDQAGLPYPVDSWTWSDFLEMAKKLTKHDETGRVTQYGFDGWAWQNFVYGNGGALVDDVKSPSVSKLDDPKSIEGLQFYADLINKHKVMPAPVTMTNLGMGAERMFASGRIAMFLSGIWETPAFRQKYDFRWDVAMFPKNAEGIRRFGSGGTGYGVLKSTKHPKEAWEVVKGLTSAAVQSKMAEKGLAQPSLRSIASGEKWALSPLPPMNKKMLNEAVDYIVFDPFHPRWREIEAKYIIPEIDLLKAGKKTAQEIVQTLVPKINQALLEA